MGLCRPLKTEPGRLSNTVILFGGDNRRCVGIPLTRGPWKCVIQERQELDGSFMEMLLKHIVYRSPMVLSAQYYVACNWLGRGMQKRLNGAGVTWDSLVEWTVRALSSKRCEENTLVVPFNDKSHWSVFVVERGKTFVARDFLVVVQLGWAQVQGQEPGSRKWRELAMRRAVRVACPQQEGIWECGYVACLRFWEYFLWRGTNVKGSDRNLRSPNGWVQWPATMYHGWFLQVFYTDLANPGEGYNPPLIAAVSEEESDSDVDGQSSCVVLEEPGPLQKKSRLLPLGLDAMLSHRPIRNIQVQTDRYPSMICRDAAQF